MNKLPTISLCLVALLSAGTVVRAEDNAPPKPAPAVVVEKTVAEKPAAAPAATVVVEEPAGPLVIDYNEAEMQTVLRTLSARAKLNLVLSDEVTGKVTVHLEGVTFEEAMRLIAESKGFAFVKDKNVVRIRTKESIEAEPLEVRTVVLNYSRAEELKKTLDGMLPARGKIQVDTRMNALVISDTPTSQLKLIPLVTTLDSQTSQVMIEAKFIETLKNPHKDLGVNWAGTLVNHSVSFGAPSSSSSGGGGASASTTPGATLPVQFIKAASTKASPWMYSAMLDVGSAQATFSFLSQDTSSELLANPRVVTTDGTKAKLNITQQYPLPQFQYSEQTASMQINGFSYKDIGILLNVTPRINKDGFITLDVNPQVSSSTAVKKFQTGTSTFDIPIIETREATTTVLIKSGNTLAIGGLMRTDASDTYTKVPLMGDIPGLGALFRSKSLDKLKRNLLIFLTPTIVTADAKTGIASTGYEQYSNGVPNEEVYVNDKWLPKDNAHPRKIFKDRKATDEPAPTEPARQSNQNFGPK